MIPGIDSLSSFGRRLMDAASLAADKRVVGDYDIEKLALLLRKAAHYITRYHAIFIPPPASLPRMQERYSYLISPGDFSNYSGL
jgi:hypothetical protein